MGGGRFREGEGGAGRPAAIQLGHCARSKAALVPMKAQHVVRHVDLFLAQHAALQSSRATTVLSGRQLGHFDLGHHQGHDSHLGITGGTLPRCDSS